jgi:hypothetical protein
MRCPASAVAADIYRHLDLRSCTWRPNRTRKGQRNNMRKAYRSLSCGNRPKTHGLTLMPLLVRPLVPVKKTAYSIHRLLLRMRALLLRPHGVQGTVMHFIEAARSLTISVLTQYYTVIFGVSRGA